MGQTQDRVGNGRIVGRARVVFVQRQAGGLGISQPGEDLLKGGSIRSAEDLVGIEGEDPIGPVGLGRQSGQVVAARLLPVPWGIVAEQCQRQTLGLQLPEDRPRAIGALVVEDEVMVHPRPGVPDKGLDDVGLILDDGDGD